MKCLQNARLRTMISGVILLFDIGIVIDGNSSSDEDESTRNNRNRTAPGETLSVGIQVEISISAKKLPRADTFHLGKSDPMCVVRTKEPGSSEWVVYQSTNALKDESNPVFDKKINMTYKFEDPQPLRFEVYDVDNEEELSNLAEQKLIGFVECPLGRLVFQRELTLHLRDKKLFGEGDTKSTIHLTVNEPIKSNYEEVFLRLSGEKLEDQEWFGKSDPFVKIQNAEGRLIRTTEVKSNDLNPRWRPIHLPVRNLCGDNHDEPLLFSCWNSNSVESHKLIGEFQTTLNELKGGAKEFDLINPDKRSKRHYQNSGRMRVDVDIKMVHSLMEYFEEGLKLRCTVAIDFSASNGDPKDSSSLHHINSSKDNFNQYEQAIHSIVETIESYTSEISVFGFGARLDPGEPASQNFSVTMDPDKPVCAGIKEVLNAYRSCVPKIHFDQTAKLAPIVHRFKDNIQAQGNEYHILLILTRGSISDLKETTEAMIQASHLPMSIIVIGVGEGNFRELRRAFSTKSLERSGAGAQRDFVEFVRFNNFFSEGGDLRTAGVQLARKTLVKIPEHVASFKVAA